MTTNDEAIALKIIDLESQIRALSTTAQLAYSSIEDGPITGYNADGSLKIILGKLPDDTNGTMAVNGPPPPVPSIPICQEAPHGYVVKWDGHNADGTDVQPLDWSRVEVHSSVTSDFTYGPNTLRGTFETPQGGQKVCIAGLEYELGLNDTYEILLVARNTSGTASEPSGRVSIAVGQIGQMDIANFSLTVKKLQSLQHLLY